jgi:hypothetical protein
MKINGGCCSGCIQPFFIESSSSVFNGEGLMSPALAVCTDHRLAAFLHPLFQSSNSHRTHRTTSSLAILRDFDCVSTVEPIPFAYQCAANTTHYLSLPEVMLIPCFASMRALEKAVSLQCITRCWTCFTNHV